ncbi:MAG TPA: TNT domain-containing protein [Actinophytocola sp.]|uniref:TNT domain-containing protein n=1 Tax=Actinophytocola sp. TaxID=1872138 RepID=UPI002DDD9EB6|nr:TNT domain-containing protein [Actinophytocola sp.]HEV2780870.1 TNT domain-containing protein [Actinophytocola sp.]
MAMLRRAFVVCASALLILAGAAPIAYAGPAAFGGCSAQFYLGDPRLGPMRYPISGPVGRMLRGYNRTGRMSAEQLLTTYYDPWTGGWRYPPLDGYAIGSNGGPVRWTEHLMPGKRIDRFGGESGAFLAPAGLPYEARSIPPQDLVGSPPESCGYHEYVVARNFTVYAGPVSPWFFQPGGGLRFQLSAGLVDGVPPAADLTVKWLVDNGYLLRLR